MDSKGKLTGLVGRLRDDLAGRMQRKDKIAAGVVFGVLALFVAIPGALDGFIAATARNPYWMSFAKFAVLSTFGECIGLRITAGVYNRPGFGILPRALVWGFLGMGIKLAFTIFASGAPNVLVDLGIAENASVVRAGGFGWKLLGALTFSVTINFIFAPVFMTLHKVTDAHIAETGGTLRGFFTPIDVTRHLQNTNWAALWGFVFKKTLPFFWVPAHTITFLLPPHFQVLFAALLGVALGVILAFSSLRSRKEAPRPAGEGA